MANLDCDVLVVEDDPLVADAIGDGVRLAGYRVCGIAADIDTAVELAHRHRPRLAIIDVDLGDGDDGIEAARRMLDVGPLGIVFVTGYPERIEAADVGHAWMPKPYRLLDLINALQVVRAISERGPVTTPVPPELRLIR